MDGIQALDLSDQKIRHCGDVFESRDLMGLTELNLNDNMISSIQTLRFEFHNCINAAAWLLRMCCIPPLCSSSLLYHPVVSCWICIGQDLSLWCNFSNPSLLLELALQMSTVCCRFLTNLVTLRLDNNSFENGSLLTTSLAISATHATLTSMAEEERQGNTIDSVPSTSERGLESLEVCVSQ